jgi:hypothetical protein
VIKLITIKAILVPSNELKKERWETTFRNPPFTIGVVLAVISPEAIGR